MFEIEIVDEPVNKDNKNNYNRKKSDNVICLGSDSEKENADSGDSVAVVDLSDDDCDAPPSKRKHSNPADDRVKPSAKVLEYYDGDGFLVFLSEDDETPEIAKKKDACDEEDENDNDPALDLVNKNEVFGCLFTKIMDVHNPHAIKELDSVFLQYKNGTLGFYTIGEVFIGVPNVIDMFAFRKLIEYKESIELGCHIPKGAKGYRFHSSSIDVCIEVEGIPKLKDEVIALFKRWQLDFNTSGLNPADICVNTNDDDMDGDTVLQILSCTNSAATISKMELVEAPKYLAITLFEFQLQGLTWLLNREKQVVPEPGKNRMFWEHKEDKSGAQYFYNHVTKQVLAKCPPMPMGGILSDEMGLGKTVQTIALIVSDLENNRPPKKNRTSLIISPLSVVENWIKQIDDHTNGGLSVFLYHGNSRNCSLSYLTSFDVVISTYGTVATEFTATSNSAKSNNRLLYNINWRRVILDEGHAIKTKNSNQSKACCALPSDRRWIITGTPIQNKLDDLFTLVKFIKFTPFDDITLWNQWIVNPLKNGSTRGIEILQVLLANICLRRTKDMKIDGKPIITLPPKYIHNVQVKLSPTERALYSSLEESGRRLFRKFDKQNLAMKNISLMLELITRQRQFCDHKSLCLGKLTDVEYRQIIARHERYLKKIEEEKEQEEKEHENEEDTANLEELVNLFKQKRDEEKECSICMDDYQKPVITKCNHVFCHNCIIKSIEQNGSDCPMCRQLIREDELTEEPKLPEAKASSPSALCSNDQNLESSDKIEKILELLSFIREKDPKAKTVIFSQWVGMLNILQSFLIRENFQFEDYRGSLTLEQRNLAAQNFRTNDNIVVLLASLRCAGFGLNLTEAENVIIVDPWWNLASENQAIDRVHRIGQKKDVNVYRMSVQNTVEEKILFMQEKKEELCLEAFGKGHTNRSAKQKTRLNDLRFLFSKSAYTRKDILEKRMVNEEATANILNHPLQPQPQPQPQLQPHLQPSSSEEP